jgi:hypothetical protein
MRKGTRSEALETRSGRVVTGAQLARTRPIRILRSSVSHGHDRYRLDRARQAIFLLPLPSGGVARA